MYMEAKHVQLPYDVAWVTVQKDAVAGSHVSKEAQVTRRPPWGCNRGELDTVLKLEINRLQENGVKI